MTPAETPRCARCGQPAFNHPVGRDDRPEFGGLEWVLLCPAFVPPKGGSE